MRRLAILVVLVLIAFMGMGLLAAGFSGGGEEKKPTAPQTTAPPTTTSPPTTTPATTPPATAAPEYKVMYTPIAEDGTAYLKVRIEGEPNYLKVMLSDPEGATVDTRWISEDELLDGVETIKLQMAEFGKTPEAGTYTLQILNDVKDELIYSQKITFKGPEISIKDADFETTFYEGLGFGAITKVKLVITNEGDLPAIIDGGVVIVGSKSEEIVFAWEEISPKQTRELIEPIYITDLKRVDYPVTIKLYSGDKELTEYRTTVKV